MQIDIKNENDRLTVAAILVKNKYKVWQGCRRDPGKRAGVYYVEFERIEGGESTDDK